MSPAINEETLQRLRERAEATTTTFGISYSEIAAWTIYQRAREAAENQEPDNLNLTYRDFDSVVRTDLLTGYVDVRVGEGPGAMKDWKKVYCVERSDYGIEFYASQRDYERKKKPKTTIQPVGYTVLTKDVAKPFRKLIEPIARGLDVNPTAIEGLVEFPDDSWALFHPQRTKYVFRMSGNTTTSCCCNTTTANNDEEGSINRNDWISFLQTCVRKAKPRDTDTVLGLAFEKACRKIPAKVETLKDWKDDGTEDEMLLEMLMTSCFPPLRDDILAQIKEQLSIPIAPLRALLASCVLIPIWYTVVDLIKETLQSVLAVVWTKIQEEAQALLERVNSIVRLGLTPIVTVHNKVLDGIKAATDKTIGRLLSEIVTPLIDPMIGGYAKPLTDGFSFARETSLTAVTAEDFPTDAAERHKYLDAIPRRRTTMKKCYSHALQLLKGLEPAKRMIYVTLRIIRSNAEVDCDEEEEVELCSKAEDSFLKGLDAVVYTLHLRLKKGEEVNSDQKELLLKEGFDHDVIHLKRDVVKTGIRQFVLKYFQMAIDTDGELRRALASVEETASIPTEMKDFLSVQSIFDGFIEVAVGEPIDRMVEAAETLQ